MKTWKVTSFRAALLAVFTALSLTASILASSGQARAEAPDSTAVAARDAAAQHAQNVSIHAASRSGKTSLIKDGPIYTADEAIDFGNRTAEAFLNPVEEEDAPVAGAPGEVSPQFSVGYGRSIYLRMSPADQKFILAVGAAGTAALLCATTAGAACAIAGFAAGSIVAWVNAYQNLRCWIELKISYGGYVQGISRVYNCR